MSVEHAVAHVHRWPGVGDRADFDPFGSDEGTVGEEHRRQAGPTQLPCDLHGLDRIATHPDQSGNAAPQLCDQRRGGVPGGDPDHPARPSREDVGCRVRVDHQQHVHVRRQHVSFGSLTILPLTRPVRPYAAPGRPTTDPPEPSAPWPQR